MAATIELKRDVSGQAREILTALPGVVVRSGRGRTTLRVDGLSWDLALVRGGPHSYAVATTPVAALNARRSCSSWLSACLYESARSLRRPALRTLTPAELLTSSCPASTSTWTAVRIAARPPPRHLLGSGSSRSVRSSLSSPNLQANGPCPILRKPRHARPAKLIVS